MRLLFFDFEVKAFVLPKSPGYPTTSRRVIVVFKREGEKPFILHRFMDSMVEPRFKKEVVCI